MSGSYTRVILGLDPVVRIERAAKGRQVWRLMGRVLDRYEEGLSERQIAASLGVTRPRVWRLLRRLDVVSNRGRKKSE